MSKISNEMIEASYEVGKSFFNRKVTLREGVENLVKIGMNPNSAVDYIYN